MAGRTGSPDTEGAPEVVGVLPGLVGDQGIAFFGFNDVVALLRRAANDLKLSASTDDQIVEMDQQYAYMISDDSILVARFEDVFRQRPDQFAPLNVVT
jgi:hypothetical protein